MADTKIGDASNIDAIAGGDEFAVADASAATAIVSCTADQLATFIAPQAAGRFLGQFIYATSGSGTHTVGATTNSIRFVLVGGGGGGAGVAGNAGNAAFSGGGSAGGYTKHVIAVTPNTGYGYNVGAGGTAAANNAAGGAGAETNLTIAAAVFRAAGGAGATNMANGATNLATAAIATTPANTANTPNIAIGGQGGCQGWRQNGIIGASGDGGCSILGAGGRGVTHRAAAAGVKGDNATAYGAGGAGGCGNSNANGGNGANGLIIIEEFR